MPKPAQPDDPTPAAREQARTRLARRAVVDAAKHLFLERGYAATTIEAISAHADVPAATVYRLFASKVGILKALIDASIAGDDEPVAVQERTDVKSLFDATDPAVLLAGSAGITTAINERTNDVYRVLVSAADSDSAAAVLLEDMQRQRDTGQRQIVDALERTGALRDGLTAHEAADVVHALMAPEVYRLLVVDRNWSAEQYRQWLASILVHQLT